MEDEVVARGVLANSELSDCDPLGVILGDGIANTNMKLAILICLAMLLTLSSLTIINFLVAIVESHVSIGQLRKSGRKPKPSGYGNRPRGVPFERGPFYAVGETFACVDNSKSIPFSQVNDDYCDCLDGSDEPGTSACPNAKFHCLNRGFKAEDLPSNRVNDQICDCCDGSDEWDSAVDCPDICNELGAKYREEIRQKTELVKQGFLKRVELATVGQKLKTEKSEKLKTLKVAMDKIAKLRTDAQTKMDEKANLAAEAKKKHEEAWEEEKEKLKQEYAQVLFTAFDSNKDEKVTLEELKLAKEFDANGDGIVSDDEVKHVLPEGVEDCNFEVFLESAYDNIRNLFEKPSEIEAEDENEPQSSLPSPIESNSELPDNSEIDISQEIKLNESENIGLEIPRIPNIDLKQPAYDEETQAIVKEAQDAKKEYDKIDKHYADLNLSIKDSEQYEGDDFGTDMAWASLKGKCFEMDENEYIYKLCLFDKAVQKGKNSATDTDLGKWSGWIGPEPNKYTLQSYQNGTPCWNGPDRSTKVITECGEETQLVDASEPSKCEYLFILRSPAACPDPATITDQHEEL
uniref:Glucosidase 2 subunit beta n=1 Tax=Elaeophora elaphi TaxID=1147741 RepID=A0A0R3RX96_9BILA